MTTRYASMMNEDLIPLAKRGTAAQKTAATAELTLRGNTLVDDEDAIDKTVSGSQLYGSKPDGSSWSESDVVIVRNGKIYSINGIIQP